MSNKHLFKQLCTTIDKFEKKEESIWFLVKRTSVGSTLSIDAFEECAEWDYHIDGTFVKSVRELKMWLKLFKDY